MDPSETEGVLNVVLRVGLLAFSPYINKKPKIRMILHTTNNKSLILIEKHYNIFCSDVLLLG